MHPPNSRSPQEGTPAVPTAQFRPAGISVRIWRLMAYVSLGFLGSVVVSMIPVLCVWILAPTSLGLALYQTFLLEIPESRIGREIGALTLYVVGVPGLNTSGRPGDDWTLKFKGYYPPVLLPSIVLGLIVGLAAIHLIARKRTRRTTR